VSGKIGDASRFDRQANSRRVVQTSFALSRNSSQMVPRPQSSAAGVLSLLAEQEPLLKQHALNTLISLVPQFWAEISEHIALM
jgi:hypothetical protein